VTTKPPSFKPALDQPAPAGPPSTPFFGMGGSYSQDPATGVTALIERAGHPQAGQATPETPQSTPAQE
jgi:hypothetical protein